MQALTSARPTFNREIQHVRSHQGLPGNELADQIAKFANQSGHARPCAHQTWAAHWIRKGALAWLWLHIESALTPAHWPLHIGSSIVDTSRHIDATSLTVEESHRALGLPSPEEQPASGRVFHASLLFVSVNVQSLTDKDSVATDTAQQDGFTGKARYLREQLQYNSVQVAALQEARSPADATYISDTHIRICTGRDSKGNFGCELWFSRTLPFTQADGACGTFHPKDLLTLSATPRELLVRFSRSGLHVLFACIHAPVAGDQDREPWWLQLSQRLACLSHGASVVLIGDYNTSFSEPVPARIGDLVWPAKHRVPEGLSSILRRHDLWLPSTFWRYHTGQHETWISPTGSTGARLDYIAIPAHWNVPPSGSWVDTSLDWGQARVDHFGVGAQTHFVFGSKTPGQRRSVGYDRDTIRSEEGQKQLAKICRDIPLQRWDTNVHRHYLALEQHLTAALSVAFPAQRGNCRSSHFSSATWDVRQRRAWLRRHLARARTGLRLDAARAALLAWRRRVPVWVGRILGIFPSILTARIFQGLVQELQHTKGQLRHLVRSDIRRRVQETAAAAASIPKADVVTRLRPLLGPPKRRQKQRRSLRTVCGPDGAPASTPEQAEDLWIAHFAGLEAGKPTDPTQLAERIFRRQQERDLNLYDLDVAEIPSRVALERSLRQTQTGKALGTDNVPGELLHFAAGTASRALYQLFLKISLRCSEPLQFKGGTLYAVWKGKNDPSACSSHRGILVSSTPGKAFHRLLRDSAVGALQNVSTAMQIGGLPKFPVVLASHFVRLFQAGCRGRHLSHGLLFLDLREAFYRVVRPLLTGTNNSDEDIAAVVRAVSLPPGTMHELHKHLQGRSLAEEAGASRWTDLGLQDALDGTWFRFQGGHKVVETGIGSRPGDNLADVCFSFIFAKVLRSVRDELDGQNLLPTIPWSANLLCEIMPATTTPVDSLQALDATWMDDATFLVSATRSVDLENALRATGSAVVDACLGHALLPNLDRGKTEFVAAPTGPGSRSVRANLFGGIEPGISLMCRLWPQARVRLVSSYQHLGGYIHHDTSLIRELRHRTSQAWQAFNSRKKRVFGSPGVARGDKRILFESLILSVLLHGAGTWDALSPKEHAVLESALHGMAFYMLRPEMTYEEALHLGGERVISLLGLPSLSTLLHVARLRHLLSCAQTRVPIMWGLLHWQSSWLASIRTSLSWLWALIGRDSAAPTWESAWGQWREICITKPRKWKGMLRRAQHQAVLRETLGMLGQATPWTFRQAATGRRGHCPCPTHRLRRSQALLRPVPACLQHIPGLVGARVQDPRPHSRVPAGATWLAMPGLLASLHYPCEALQTSPIPAPVQADPFESGTSLYGGAR